jgi:two-component system, sensor histidine kinase and response regulator
VEALKMLDKVQPDIILLDVMMPELDGFEVCRQLKSDEQWRHVPLILITALDEKTDLARGFEAGADDFLHKPVNDIELRSRVRAMLRIKQQYDELVNTLRLREDLSHMIVHDMRSPITAIIGFSELILMKGASPQILSDIERIHEQALTLSAFLNDMLIMAKMESGRLILNRSAVNLNELVKKAEQGHVALAGLKHVKLETVAPCTPRIIQLDQNLFQRVLDNLISNAVKFSPPEAIVTLQLDYPDGRIETGAGPAARISVLDEGPGIPEEYWDRIFDKFEVVELVHTAEIDQIGIGLAFCKLVTEAHGGRIYVKGNQPQGSIFVIEI